MSASLIGYSRKSKVIFQKLFFTILIITLFSVGAVRTYASGYYAAAKISSGLQQHLSLLQPGDKISVVVRLHGRADIVSLQGVDRNQRLHNVVTALRGKAELDQKHVRQLLKAWEVKGKVSDVKYLWIINGLQLSASPEVIRDLASQPEVQEILYNEVVSAPFTPIETGQVEENLSQVNATDLWDLGFRGKGIVVANMDTGVYLDHPSLKSKWRGGENSWFDPYGEHPNSPIDNNGHGTLTMGIMVGDDGNGTVVGVAPEAKWIAVRIFNDAQQATVGGIHQAFQWLLDPDGDPDTADAPHVVNSSWLLTAPGCNLEFQADLQALRAAGILPVFSAGNHGPNPESGRSPANYPEAFSVGAVGPDDSIAFFSSRGPTDCDSNSRTYPHLVAPGVNISTTDANGEYSLSNGTSFAAPHVAGGLALLLSAFPDLSVEEQEQSLMNSVVDLGPDGPDNSYGVGRLDLLEAYRWLADDSSGQVPPQNPPLASQFVYFPVLSK